MTDDLTIDTLSFKLRFSDKKDGSERRETSRGVTLPTVMTIRHQDIIDSATKLPCTRSVLRFDRYVLADNGQIVPVTSYRVTQVPKVAGVESADVLAVVQHCNTVEQEDDSGLDLMEEIYVNLEQ
jgi:hypothetical protein